jgi:hypothetical protein
MQDEFTALMGDITALRTKASIGKLDSVWV